jgi:DNA-binding transcriptional MerR regulator
MTLKIKEKKYKTIKEVSQLLDINTHVIRYWDSKFEGISTRLKKNKQRFFNAENIKKLTQLKNTLYQNGKHNYSLELANKIINYNNTKNYDSLSNYNNFTKENTKFDIKQLKKIKDNLEKILDL